MSLAAADARAVLPVAVASLLQAVVALPAVAQAGPPVMVQAVLLESAETP